MLKKNNIEEILNSLVGVKRAAPGPFFTGRVLQKLQQPESAASPVVSSTRMAWVISAVVLIIALNLTLFFASTRSADRTISEWKSTTPKWVVEYTENPGSSIYDVPNK